MVEGQTYRVAATCRAVARPMPRLSWDTDLPGQAINRSSGPGSVSSYFSLHPLRGMNGKKLDCLVWHLTLDRPRRIQNSLVVHCEFSDARSFPRCLTSHCSSSYSLLIYLHFSVCVCVSVSVFRSPRCDCQRLRWKLVCGIGAGVPPV